MIYPQAEDQERAMAAAMPLLRPIHDDLTASFARYWSEEYSAAVRAEHKSRTIANIVYDHAEKLFRQREDEIQGLTARNVKGLTLFDFNGIAVVRIKKVNADGKHRNYPTQQQKDFDDQLTFEEFPDEAFRLVAGYQPDVTGSYIERVIIVRKIGGITYWNSQINLLDEEARWEDATPPRLFGLDLTHWRPGRERRRGRG